MSASTHTVDHFRGESFQSLVLELATKPRQLSEKNTQNTKRESNWPIEKHSKRELG